MLDFIALTQQCAPTVDPQTMAAIVKVESNHNPYAIGVVGGRLARQPTNHEEAVATAKQLGSEGWNFSVGLAQINRAHLSKHQLSYDQAFDACTNLHVGSKILEECYVRATQQVSEPQAALRRAFSCYYSGNFWRGFKSEGANKPSYVQKVLTNARTAPNPIPVVPSIQKNTNLKQLSNEVMNSKDLNTVDILSAESIELPSDNTPLLLPSSNKEDNPVTRPQLLTTGANERVYEEINDSMLLDKIEQGSKVLVF